MILLEEQILIADFRKRMGWEYWDTVWIGNRLSEETGEIQREIMHKYGPKKKKDTEEPSDIEGEAGDAFYTLICLANKEGFSLREALIKTLEKYEKRDKDRFNASKPPAAV